MIAFMNVNFSELVCMLLLIAAVWLFWRSILTYPMLLLVALFHEAGHALVAAATGGRVMQISINRRLGGSTDHAGGNELLATNAGYLGSILIGFLFFWMTYTSKNDVVLIVMGLLMILVAVMWVKDIFTWVFCFVVGLLLVALGYYITGLAENLIARYISLCTALYAFFEMHRCCSDAKKLKRITFVPAVGWFLIWIIMSLGVFIVMARLMLTSSFS